MATIDWKSAVSGDWAIAARWAGGLVPGAGDAAVIDESGTYKVTIDSPEAADSLTVDNATATVVDTGTLTLGSTLTLTAGEFDLDSGGEIVGGALSAPHGGFVWNGGTLSGVTFKGPLSVNGSVTVRDGLVLTGASGAGSGVLNLTGGRLDVVAGETLDNVTLNLSGALYVDATDNADPNLTFGARAHVVAKGGYIAAGAAGAGVVNNGTFTANVSGGDFQIDLTGQSPGAITNNGSMSVSNNDTLQLYFATGTGGSIINNGSIALNGGALQLNFADAVTNHGAIDIVNGGGLYDAAEGIDAFANAADGSILVRGTGSVAVLSGVSVSNAGTITFSGGAAGYFGGAGSLTNAVTNNGTIDIVNGGGLYDEGDGAFANAADGSIIVRGTGSVAVLSGVSVSNAGTITFSGGATGYLGTYDAPWSNAGTITVESKATLHLNGQPITTADLTGIVDESGIIAIDTTLVNTGSVLTIGAGSDYPIVDLDYESEIVGGVIVDHGSGLRPASGDLSGVTYDGTLDLSAANSRLFVENGFATYNLAGTGPGKIDLTGVGAYFGAAGSETLDNATLDIGAAGAGAALALEDPTGLASVLTFGSHFKIIQTGLTALIEDPQGRRGDAIINDGAIIAGVSGGTFEVSSKDGPLTVVRSFTNNGSIVVSNGDVMNLQPAIFTNLVSGTLTGGSYEVDAGSTLELKPVGLITVDNARIILDGVGSAIRSLNMTTMTQTSIDSSLYQVAAGGVLEILGGRDWTSARVFLNGGALDLGGGTFSVAHLTNTGVIDGAGVIVPLVFNEGTIIVSGGVLEMEQRITGPGEFKIEAGATLQVDASATAGGTVQFAGAGATLALGEAGVFTSRVLGFAAGDSIDLLNTAATGASFANDRLVITNGASTIAGLRLIGDFTGDSFTLASDGHGGTDITLTTAAPAPHALVQAIASMNPPTAASAGLVAAGPASAPILAATTAG